MTTGRWPTRQHYRDYESGAYAVVPRCAFDRWSQPPPSLPNVYQRPFLRWDPCGMRRDASD